MVFFLSALQVKFKFQKGGSKSKCVFPALAIPNVTWCLLKPFPHRIGSQHGKFLHYLEQKTKQFSTG